MGIMQAIYGKLADNTEKLYLSILKNIENEAFERGVKKLIEEYEYPKFPPPAVIIKYCGRSSSDMANLALMALKKAIHKVGPYNSVDFRDNVLHAVIERYGGWVEICNWTDDDFNYREKQFLKSYESTHSSGIKGPDYLPGITETSNAFNGYFEHIPQPKQLKMFESGRIGFVDSKKDYSRIEHKSGNDRLQLPGTIQP